MNPSISVIIPSYNSALTIGRVLDGVLRQPANILKEVIVVDSSDDRATPAVLSSYPPDRVRVIHLSKKTIPATARNIGAGVASGRILAFLDADAFPEEDWLRRITEAHRDGCLLGGGSVLIPEDQRKSPVAVAQFFLQFNEFLAAGPVRRVKFTPSCNLFCDKEIFERTGGFPKIRAAEDVVFGLKAGKITPFLFFPDIRVRHIFRLGIRPFLANQELLGKYVLIYRRAYYGSFLYKSFVPLIFVPAVVIVKILRIVTRVLMSKNAGTLALFLISLPAFVLGILFWTFGFILGCLETTWPEWHDRDPRVRKKILFITNLLPYPLDNGGKIRTHQTLSILKTFCDIDLLCFVEKKSDLQFKERMADTVVDTECVHKTIRYHQDKTLFFWQFLKSILTEKSYVVSKYSSDVMKTAVRRKLLEDNYDQIYVDHLQLFQFVPPALLKKYPDKVILDMHNVESDLVRSMMDNAKNVIVKTCLSWEYKKLLEYEKRACSTAGIVFAITEENRRRFLEITKGKCRVFVAPFVMDPYGGEKYDPAQGKTILFLGTMSWFPNEQGILWFYEQVFKKKGLAQKGWKLLIVGNSPSRRVLGLAGDPSVEVTGYVEDVKPYLRRGLVGIVPLQIRAGLRIKALEFMAFGLPVISTSTGADGIPHEDGKNILIADNAKAFAQALDLLAEDPSLRQRLSAGGPKLLQDHYSSSSAIKKYSELMNHEISAKAATRGSNAV